MPRKLRGPIAPGIYHVTRRSAGPIAMFRDDIDRTDFCNHLNRVVTRFAWTCHAFCLMTTHYHLLLSVEQDALQPGMHALNGPYAQAFNLRHGRNGHLRGSPYGARVIGDDDDFLGVVRYIALNPVRGGLCVHPADWVWSSYRQTAGYVRPGFPFVANEQILRCLSEDVTRSRRLLRVLVESL
ncbi:MAG TPA: transposase [Gaiellaceae bacterium]|jgi:putative transposase|nr:transposase [Gaiellaceae bacterium]